MASSSSAGPLPSKGALRLAELRSQVYNKMLSYR